MTTQILQGDCRAVMRTMGENSVDAVVCDPPYDLTANKKGGIGTASENLNSPAGRSRITTGFMGKEWDGTGVAFDPATWVEVLRVLKPGGYLLSFSGTRTYHRMACAVEDAGFEIRDQIQWLFGSGFPKSLDVERAIDSFLCVLPGRHYWAETSLPTGDKGMPDDHVCPSTWQGREHEGEGTALKPANEPLVVARKPLIGTVAENVLQHGTGAMNIGACRIPFADAADAADAKTKNQHADFGSGPMTNQVFGRFDKDRDNYDAESRWPANVIIDGSPEVVAAFPSTDSVGHFPAARGQGGVSTNGHNGQSGLPERHIDSGSAARFYYCAKASQEDRDEGLEEFVRRQRDDSRKEGNPGGDNPRNRGLAPRANHHPTVKPTDLMRYLCRLVTPSGGTVLDPFMGSGSTGKAAVLEGLNFIGIEQDAEYLEIARYRIDAAGRQGQLFQ